MYTAMSWNAFVSHWISYPDLMPMDGVLSFLHFQSVNLCSHTGATAPPNENMGNYTHTITQVENINIKFMYDMYDLLIQSCVEKHTKCAQMCFKHFNHALRSKGEKKILKIKILSAARKWDLKAINIFFVCFKPIQWMPQSWAFLGAFAGKLRFYWNRFWGFKYISNCTQIRKNEKSLLFKEEQEDRMTLRKL